MFSARIECEVCIDSVDGALAAEAAGADRVELCANLHEGGTTPSFGMTQAVLATTQLPVMVMIRPRGGDFCFDQGEKDVMLRDIECLLAHKTVGFVIGALTPEGSVDRELCRDLCELARGHSITFHRAFDLTRDPAVSLDHLIELGCDRVLTSGQCRSAEQGIPLLRQLTEQGKGKIAIMAGAGIRPDNVARIIRESQVQQIHFSASSHVDSQMQFMRPEVPMSSADPPNDRLRRVTSQQMVRSICQVARDISETQQ